MYPSLQDSFCLHATPLPTVHRLVDDVDPDRSVIVTKSAIIDTAGAMDPGIISQVTTTIGDYFMSRLDASISRALAPLLPAIYDVMNYVIFPFLDGITIGIGEILGGFPQIRRWMAAVSADLHAINVARMEAERERFLQEEFFPAMDQLYEGREGFVTDLEIIEEQAALRGSRPGGSQVAQRAGLGRLADLEVL